jgi:hypothetical protein
MAYNILSSAHVIINGDMSGNITSAPLETKLQDNIGIQLNWTGTPSGTFGFYVSMDYAQDAFGNVTNPGHWIQLPVNPTITASGVPDQAYVDLNQLSAPYVKVVYSANSGAGVLNLYMAGKGI